MKKTAKTLLTSKLVNTDYHRVKKVIAAEKALHLELDRVKDAGRTVPKNVVLAIRRLRKEIEALNHLIEPRAEAKARYKARRAHWEEE